MRYLLTLLLACAPVLAGNGVTPWDNPQGTNTNITGIDGEVSTDNSTTSVLASGAVFTGEWEEISGCAIIIITTYASHASATDGLVAEFSSDGTNVDSTDEYTVPAATGKTYSFNPATKWFRIKYTNGGTLQTEFRLQTICKYVYAKPSSHRIQDAISTDDDAELTKAVLTGADASNVFRNVRVTQDGNLTISDNSSGLSIAQGNVTGVTFVHKFGAAPDFRTADNEVTITDMADSGAAWENMVYDYSATADIDSISSSSSADQALNIEIQGLDANYDLVTQTVATDGTDGQTRVALSTSLRRVFRMKNQSGTDIAGGVGCYPNTALTAGLPTDKSKIRAIINDGNNQTEMAVYTVPNGKTAYLRSLFASTAGANKTSNYIIKLYARELNGVFQLKHRMAISDSASSHIQHQYVEPEVFTAKTDIHMTVEMTAAGGTGAAIAAGFDIVLIDD